MKKTWAQLNGCMIQKTSATTNLQPVTKDDVSGMFYHEQKTETTKNKTTTY